MITLTKCSSIRPFEPLNKLSTDLYHELINTFEHFLNHDPDWLLSYMGHRFNSINNFEIERRVRAFLATRIHRLVGPNYNACSLYIIFYYHLSQSTLEQIHITYIDYTGIQLPIELISLKCHLTLTSTRKTDTSIQNITW